MAFNELLKNGVEYLSESYAVTVDVQIAEDSEGSRPKTGRDSGCLGTFSTDFSSSGYARATNVQVGASKRQPYFNAGETLSGYECLSRLPLKTAIKMLLLTKTAE